MAASYMAYFWTYLAVSFVEIFGWIAYASGYNLMIRVWSEFTYYTFIWYIPAWLFAFVEMTAPISQGGLSMNVTSLYFTNSAVLFAVGLVMWIYISGIHIYYVPILMDHIDTVNSVCKCNITVPSVSNVGDKAREYAEALEKAECLKKCPPPDILDKIKASEKLL
jgi:hypothetical protein